MFGRTWTTQPAAVLLRCDIRNEVWVEFGVRRSVPYWTLDNQWRIKSRSWMSRIIMSLALLSARNIEHFPWWISQVRDYDCCFRRCLDDLLADLQRRSVSGMEKEKAGRVFPSCEPSLRRPFWNRHWSNNKSCSGRQCWMEMNMKTAQVEWIVSIIKTPALPEGNITVYWYYNLLLRNTTQRNATPFHGFDMPPPLAIPDYCLCYRAINLPLSPSVIQLSQSYCSVRNACINTSIPPFRSTILAINHGMRNALTL